MKKLRPIELLLIQLTFYIFLWISNDYLATIISLIFGTICLLIFLISLIVEWIEHSGVPKWYYKFMIVSIIAPIIAAVIYLGISGGVDWMRI